MSLAFEAAGSYWVLEASARPGGFQLIRVCVYCGGELDPSPQIIEKEEGCHRDERGQPRFCRGCRRAFDDLSLADVGHLEELPLYCGFRYQGVVRQLIMEVKVGGSHTGMRLLQGLMGENPVIREWLAWADLIVPAPSSLWGRLHGRLDIAGIWAEHLARQGGVALGRYRGPLFWRMRKRAFMGNWRRRPGWMIGVGDVSEGKNSSIITNCCVGENPHRVLIVDDIVTSGFTMATIAGHYRTQTVKLLGIATANPRFLHKRDVVDELAKQRRIAEHDTDDAPVF